MSKVRKLIFLFILIIFPVAFLDFSLFAEDIHVPDDYPTIQDAVNSASPCDTVILSPGTYYEHVVMKQGISIVGETSNEEDVIVDGSGYGTVFYGEDSSSIRNLTIQNGEYGIWAYSQSFIVENCLIRENTQGVHIYYANPAILENRFVENSSYGIYMLGSEPLIYRNSIQDSERGIHAFDSNGVIWGNSIWGCERGISLSNSNPTIKENTFEGNTTGIHLDYSGATISGNTFSTNAGTGIYILSSSPDISGNIFIENFSGIFMTYSNPAISNNTISLNEWAGIYAGLDSDPTIMNNLIYENSGAGIYIFASEPDIYNNNIVTNESGILSISSNSSIRGNIIAFNTSYGILVEGVEAVVENYNDLYENGIDLGGISAGWGTIFNDPLFSDYSSDGDWENDDWRLLPSSPCIDAGIPGTAFLDPDGTRNDIGAEGGPLSNWEYSYSVNHAPTGDSDVEYYTYEGVWTTIYAQNVRDEDGDPLFYRWDFDETDGLAYCDAFGSTPSYMWEDNGLYPAYLHVNDPFGETVELIYEITVYNSPPTLSIEYSGTEEEGSPVDFYIDVTDSGSLDTFNYYFDFDNDGIYETENGANPFIEWTWFDNGVYMVRVKVIDDDSGEGEDEAILTITNADPKITSTPPSTAFTGEEYIYKVEVYDPGTLDTHEFSLLDAPSGMEIDDNGLLTWLPSTDDVGMVTFFIQVVDDDGGECYQEVDLSVEIPEEGPEGEGEAGEDQNGCDCSIPHYKMVRGGQMMTLLLLVALFTILSPIKTSPSPPSKD